MVFSSILFLYIFLPVFLSLYFLLPVRIRNLALLIASMIFYAWGEPIYILLMLFSTIVDYTCGFFTQKYRDNKKKARVFVIISIAINLSMLGFFKYYDFFATSVLPFAGLPILGLSLPIGISFYTFQSMSYTIDVYRHDADAQRDFIDFATYVVMFPQLIAGPIVKYKDIAAQLKGRKEGMDFFGEGVRIFLCGLAKKVILANNIGFLWDTIKSTPNSEMSVGLAWIGIIAFGFQVYFDFSGYSDMAVGLAKMLGFKLNINFNYPYTAQSITDFWRRWHISLSTWFKEYVYIPLGGNRKGSFATYKNLLIVWCLTGFWHGANFNYLLWGLYFAVVLMMEKAYILKFLQRLPRALKHIYALLVVAIGWVIFAFEDINAGANYLSMMFGNANTLWNELTSYWFFSFLPVLIVLIISSTPLFKNLSGKIYEKKYFAYLTVAAGVIVLFVSTAYLVDSTYNPFLYFRF